MRIQMLNIQMHLHLLTNLTLCRLKCHSANTLCKLKCHLANTLCRLKCYLANTLCKLKCHLANTLCRLKCHLANTFCKLKCHLVNTKLQKLSAGRRNSKFPVVDKCCVLRSSLNYNGGR